jgi:hypothetical protein
VVALRKATLETLVLGQTWAIVSPVVNFIRRRGARQLGALLIALFWLSVGVLAILTTGIEGFFLNRLHTQVEPERALLLVAANIMPLQVAMSCRHSTRQRCKR